MACINGLEPDFVLRGFCPRDSFTGGASIRCPRVLMSLLSKQLMCQNAEDATSSSDDTPCMAGSDSDSGDSLCCDDEPDFVYAEELLEVLGSAPIPICVNRSSTKRQRELLVKLELLQQVEEMKRAAERYTKSAMSRPTAF